MTIYAIYYIDDGNRDFFMRREDAQSCGVGYIRQIGEEENWDILSRTFPVKASAKASAAKGMAPMNGRVAGVAKRK